MGQPVRAIDYMRQRVCCIEATSDPPRRQQQPTEPTRPTQTKPNQASCARYRSPRSLRVFSAFLAFFFLFTLHLHACRLPRVLVGIDHRFEACATTFLNVVSMPGLGLSALRLCVTIRVWGEHACVWIRHGSTGPWTEAKQAGGTYNTHTYTYGHVTYIHMYLLMRLDLVLHPLHRRLDLREPVFPHAIVVCERVVGSIATVRARAHGASKASDGRVYHWIDQGTDRLAASAPSTHPIHIHIHTPPYLWMKPRNHARTAPPGPAPAGAACAAGPPWPPRPRPMRGPIPLW